MKPHNSDRVQTASFHWQPQSSQASVPESPTTADASLRDYSRATRSSAEQNNLGKSHPPLSKLPLNIQCWDTTTRDHAVQHQADREYEHSSQVLVNQADDQQNQHFCDKALSSVFSKESNIDHENLSSMEKAECLRKRKMPSNLCCIFDNLQETTRRSEQQPLLPHNLLEAPLPRSAATISDRDESLRQLCNTHCSVNLWRLREHEQVANKDSMHNSSSHMAAISNLLPHTIPGTLKEDESLTNLGIVHNLKQYSWQSGTSAVNCPLSQRCCEKLKCAGKLSKNWQRQLRCKFWNSESFLNRQEWMLNHFADLKNNHLLPQTISCRKWFMPDSSGNLIKVCRVFFLQTLAYKWDSILHFLLKDSLLLKRHFRSKCHPSSRSEKNVKLLVLMHIKSFLKKYHLRLQEYNGSRKRVVDYNLVKRSFHSFIATHPYLTVSYQIFRQIFYAIFAIFNVDPEYISIMPPVLLLKRACQKFALLDDQRKDTGKNSNQKYTFLDDQRKDTGKTSNQKYTLLNDQREDTRKTSNRTVVEALPQPNRKIRNPKMSMKGQKQDKNVIMHLDIDNDDIVITKNASYSDTENEEDELTSQTAKTSVIKPAFSIRTSHPNSSHNKIQFQMKHSKEDHPLLSPCRCSRRCFAKISEARRKEIYTSFWNLRDCVEQKQWIDTHTQVSHHKRRLKWRKVIKRSYILTNDINKSVMVCAVYFQRTLGLTGANWFNSLCGSSSLEDTQFSCLNQMSPKEHVDKINVHVQRCVELHVKNHTVLTDNVNTNTSDSWTGTSSRGLSVKTLHDKYLTTHSHSPVSFERFQIIYHQVCKSTVQHPGLGNHKNTKSNSSILIRQSTRRRNLRNCNRSLFQNVDGKDSGIPKRRKSARTTRIQGSLMQDNFPELDVESGVVSSIVCTQKHQHAKVKTDPSSQEAKLKLCPSYSKNHLSKRSDKQTRSLKVSNKSISHKKQQECPTSVQPLPKSDLYPGKQTESKTKQRKDSKIKRSVTCKYSRRKKKKESLKKENQDILLNNIKRHYQLNSLKKKHKHPLLPPCNCSRRKCISNIPEERRKEIHEHFWNLSSYGDRKRWLMKYVEKRERKIKVLSLFPQRKNESKKYFLPDVKWQTIEVCRLFFIHTLGFRWDSGVDVLVKNKSSSHVVEKSCQWKKPAHQLPEYITDSVKQYLKSIRDSQNITKDQETVSGVQNEVLDGYESADLPGLKVKDFFKGWKAKFKNLKFNLGYHSFRRIFQSVVDPILDPILDTSREGTDKTVNNTNLVDEETLVVNDDDHLSQLLQQTDTSIRNDFQNHQRVNAVDYLDNYNLGTSENGEIDTVVTSSNELSVPACTENETKNNLVHQDSGGTVLKNYNSYCSDHSAEDTDDGVLDVSSGYFKQVDSGDKHYPYNIEYQYKSRRSLSTRNDRSNYPVLPPCKCRKRKCADKFTDAHRQHINDIFWNLASYNERKQWILEHIKRADIKRRVVFTKGTPRKLESRWYYLPDEGGNKIDVCKSFFLRTLGYRWDSVIDTIGKTTPKGDKWVVPDKRGRKPPPHKISNEAVSSMTVYIENVCHTYQPLCQRKNQDSLKEGKASLIPFGLTMKQLFDDYKSKHQNHKFGYESFRKVFRRVHGAFLASLPSDLESSEEPDQAYPDMTASVDKAYTESAHVECSGSFQTEDQHFIATTESYTDLSQYTTPPPPPPPSLPPPPSSHHQEQQLTGNNLPERRSCLYQYSHESCQPPPLQPLPAMQVPDPGPSSQSDRYNSLDHDPFMKYNHNMYCQPAGMHGHFSQIGDHMPYSNGINQRTTDTMEPSTCGGHGQFPPYFMPNPEPLRRQVYNMASQYQSILHQIAESSRFFNYGSFPAPDTTHQGGQDRTYPYTRQQDFTRGNINSYNIPKTSHNFVSMSSTLPTPYPPIQHLPHNNMQQGNTSMLMSPFSDDNDNSYNHDHNAISGVTKEQDKANNECISEIKDKKPTLKVKTLPKKAKTNAPKVKKENKLRPKSARNYGDHYPMLSACNCKKKKCNEIFSENDRKRIHDMFWDLKDYNERKQWMLLHIKREDCKRRRIDQFESFRKQESRWYFFPVEDGSQHEVCKDFFLRTLGYKWDSVIDTIRRTTPKGETSTRPDQRGRKAPAHKLSNVVLRSVVQYIESMQQVSQPLIPSCTVGSGPLEKANNPICHQTSIDSSSSNKGSSSSGGQIAVPYGLTMKDLYDDYKAKHVGHKIGYESFRRIFRAVSKSEKIVFDDRTTDDDMLNPDNQDLDF